MQGWRFVCGSHTHAHDATLVSSVWVSGQLHMHIIEFDNYEGIYVLAVRDDELGVGDDKDGHHLIGGCQGHT